MISHYFQIQYLMKNYFRILIIACAIVGLSFVSQAQNSSLNFNYSAVYDFLDMVKKPEIKESDIDKLLDTEPYEKLYIWSRRGIKKDKEDFKQIFYHALLGEELAAKYKTDDFTGGLISRIIRNIKYSKQNPEKIHFIIQFLKEKLATEDVFEITYSYCPDKSINVEYTVYFIIGLAQGVGPKGFMVMDIANIDENTDIRYMQDWIAHELFHSYHNFIPTLQIKDPIYKSLNSMLEGIQQEGIGELLRYRKADFRKRNKELANALLMRLDYQLQKAFEQPSTEGFKNLYNTLYDPYTHRVALFMAYTIEQQLGKDAVIKCVGNKKDFIISYQKAAKKLNDPREVYIFSQETINNISNLNWVIKQPE